ncbi:MAG: hypothetical protein H7Y16_04620 [Candidatus Parcubacteria bacterium]|nr:hypothetical protein [Burkholderiales bacterium]
MKALQFLCAGLLATCSFSAAAVGNLADVAVFDRSEGRQLQVYWHEGRAYVVGKPGNEYQLAVRSRQGEDVLAVMSVDGVNVISGETASTQQSGYVLAPWRALEVKGWRKDLSRTAAFYFTSLSDSYAARTGRPDNVGAIGVALFRKKRPEPAADISMLSRQAPAAAAASGASAPAREEAEIRSADRKEKLGTGHGRSEASHARQVSFDRASSEPAETVVIYYDSYRNLLARGIVPPVPQPQPQPRRLSPNPFPGFVADPPA